MNSKISGQVISHGSFDILSNGNRYQFVEFEDNEGNRARANDVFVGENVLSLFDFGRDGDYHFEGNNKNTHLWAVRTADGHAAMDDAGQVIVKQGLAITLMGLLLVILLVGLAIVPLGLIAMAYGSSVSARKQREFDAIARNSTAAPAQVARLIHA